MITVYKNEKGKLVSSTKKGENFPIIKEKAWIDVTVPNEDILLKISKKTKIHYSLLKSALDPEESARFDSEEDSVLIVLDVPVEIDREDKKGRELPSIFETIPFIVAYNDNYFVTVCKTDTGLVKQVLSKNRKNIETHMHVRLALYFLMALAQQFIINLKKIDKRSRTIEKLLHSSQKNKELFELMDLNKMLVYFSTALNADKATSEKLKRASDFKKHEDDFDIMDDVQVELNQAIEMCSIYRDILAGMMDAFASIISNNLNVVMKVLSIITIVISIPTLIASFLGMNMQFPFGSGVEVFYWAIGISIAAAVLGAILLLILQKRKRK
jgi:magnesium transporter